MALIMIERDKGKDRVALVMIERNIRKIERDMIKE